MAEWGTGNMVSWGEPALLLATIINQLPVISIFVPTEPVYVYLGTQLPAAGGPSLLLCMIGVWIGSQGAFWLGRTAGARVVARMNVAPRAMAQARRLFERRGAAFVVIAQMIWPIATLTQVMAGVWGMRPATYLGASAIGAVLAIAQYAAIGYFSAAGLHMLGLQPEEPLLVWIGPYRVTIGLLLLLTLGTLLILRRARHPLPLRLAYAGLLALAMFVAVNLGALTSRAEAAGGVAPLPLDLACRALDETLIARTGDTPLHAAQPINLALSGFDDPAALLRSLGWLRNRTYAGDGLDAIEILRLTFAGLPPASSIFLDGIATDLAWQERRGTVPRTQLRLWRVAVPQGLPPVYLGAVGRIDAVTLRLWGEVPALAYDLFPYTDTARNREAEAITAAVAGARWRLVGPNRPLDMENRFESDGRLASLRTPGTPGLTQICAARTPG
ncbi:VTT domain-containing protein [Limimaricola cinnabarinus]|uniref:VTT domain-containing protein n=1 Tax=Limimaricola cinnabarinus TaxID=1125964 RepID=UPI0039E2FD75